MGEDVASATAYMSIGRFEEAIELLKKDDLSRPKVLFMISDCYLLSGQFEKAKNSFLSFKSEFSSNYLRQHEMPYLDQANEIIELFNNIGFNQFNISMVNSNKYSQSIERDDQNYPESDYVRSILSKQNENKLKQNLYELDIKKGSADNKEKGVAYFTSGELFFSAGQYQQSFLDYFEAVKISPNKALYCGFAANAIYKEAVSQLDDKSRLISLAYISSKFARQAIDLDYNNPRWHFYQYLALSALIYHNYNYIVQAAIELERAFELCRNSQKGLRSAILSSIDTIVNVKNKLQSEGAIIIPAEVFNRLSGV